MASHSEIPLTHESREAVRRVAKVAATKSSGYRALMGVLIHPSGHVAATDKVWRAALADIEPYEGPALYPPARELNKLLPRTKRSECVLRVRNRRIVVHVDGQPEGVVMDEPTPYESVDPGAALSHHDTTKDELLVRLEDLLGGPGERWWKRSTTRAELLTSCNLARKEAKEQDWQPPALKLSGRPPGRRWFVNAQKLRQVVESCVEGEVELTAGLLLDTPILWLRDSADLRAAIAGMRPTWAAVDIARVAA